MSYRDEYMQYRTSQDLGRPGPPEPPSHSTASYRPRPSSPYMNERPQSGFYDRAQTPATINSNAPLAEPAPPYHASQSPQGTISILHLRHSLLPVKGIMTEIFMSCIGRNLCRWLTTVSRAREIIQETSFDWEEQVLSVLVLCLLSSSMGKVDPLDHHHRHHHCCYCLWYYLQSVQGTHLQF